MNKTKRIWNMQAVLYFILIITFSALIVNAQINHTDTKEHIQSSENFYFTSEVLKSSPNITIYGNTGRTFSLDINNFADDLRITPSDINYSISTTSTNTFTDYSILINSTQANSGTLTGGTANTDTISLTYGDNFSDETIITLTINSTSPFSKILVCSVTLRTILANSYHIIDSTTSVCAELIITTTTPVDNNTLQIQWDYTKLNVDNSDEDFINAPTKLINGNYYYSITLAGISANESISIKFFKNAITDNFSKANTLITSNLIEIL